MRKIILSILITFVCADSETKPKSELKEDVIESVPTSYQFSYSTGNEGPAQIFREEQRSHDGSVTGKYGYVDPNGKLRIVQYRAGTNGFSASGDVGPDPEAQRQAQLFQQGDPSIRIQEEIWNKMRSLNWGNWGSNNWGPQTNWNSLNPNWNSGSVSPPPAPVPQPQLPQPSPPTPELERQWDERLQNQWDNTDVNNWRNDQNQKNVDWNTWDSKQKSWNKGGSTNSWTSKVQHQWQQAQKSYGNQDVTSGQWSQPPADYPSPVQWSKPSVDQWQQPPRADLTTGQWSPPPQPNPDLSAGQWPQAPGPNGNPLTSAPYTYFSINHSDGKSAPVKYQYSY